jgi:DNA-binding GntR family transcriptional regulator
MRGGGPTTSYIAALRAVAVAAATANTLTLFAGAISANPLALVVGLIGAAVSTYGWVFFTEEAETMEEKKNPVSYYDVATRLRWEIKNEHQPGHRLPPSRDLAHRFKVSRRTIGRALAVLATEGLVHIVPSRGCYVAGTTPDDNKLRDRVEKYILSNTRPGMWLPSGQTVAQECNASPTTVNAVVARLTRQGLLAKNGGRYKRT